MTVHRTRPLPEAAAVGHLVVPDVVVERTCDLLSEAGRQTPPHEGLVWWMGRNVGNDTLVVACHRPNCSSGPQFVFTDENAAGDASLAARRLRLGVVAQVHSHPGDDTRHSDGDDDLVLMPYEGMFSLVVGDYGGGAVHPEDGAGLHQYQQGRWVIVRDPAVVVVPTEVMA